MVIQCTQCETRFKIADDKLKPGGTKVRCSKCRHIFRVMPAEPAPEPLPRAESTDEGGFDFGDFNMRPAPEEQASAGSDSSAQGVKGQEQASGLGEKANEEKPSEPPPEGDLTGEGPIGFEEEEPLREGPMEFDFEEENPEEKIPTEFDFDDEEPHRQGPMEFDFEEGSAEEKVPTDLDFDGEDRSDLGEFSFEEEEPFPETETEAAWDTDATAGPPEDFDFGEEPEGPAEVEEFDLGRMGFGDEGPANASSNATGDSANIPLGQTQKEEPISFSTARPAEPSRRAAGKKRKTPVRAPVLPRRKSPFKGLMTFVLLLLLGLCGAAGYFLWQRGELDLAQLDLAQLDLAQIIEQLTGQGAPAPVEGQIRLIDLSSSFVTNRQAGQLFVIRGKAVNDYPDTRSAIAVKGILYDKAGKALLQQTVFCGNSLESSELRNFPFAKIEESMNNQFGDSLSNLNVGPGKSVPFIVVFKNLPSDLSEFTVETVDSKPGSKP